MSIKFAQPIIHPRKSATVSHSYCYGLPKVFEIIPQAKDSAKSLKGYTVSL